MFACARVLLVCNGDPAGTERTLYSSANSGHQRSPQNLPGFNTLISLSVSLMIEDRKSLSSHLLPRSFGHLRRLLRPTRQTSAPPRPWPPAAALDGTQSRSPHLEPPRTTSSTPRSLGQTPALSHPPPRWPNASPPARYQTQSAGSWYSYPELTGRLPRPCTGRPSRGCSRPFGRRCRGTYRRGRTAPGLPPRCGHGGRRAVLPSFRSRAPRCGHSCRRR
jgi:hypothetical protein